jgi:predicted permease
MIGVKNMNKTDIIFWGNMLVIDFMFFLTLFSPSFKTNDTFMSFNLILFVPLVFISTVKFLYKPMARDIDVKYETKRILHSNLSNDEKINRLMELELKK